MKRHYKVQIYKDESTEISIISKKPIWFIMLEFLALLTVIYIVTSNVKVTVIHPKNERTEQRKNKEKTPLNTSCKINLKPTKTY